MKGVKRVVVRLLLIAILMAGVGAVCPQIFQIQTVEAAEKIKISKTKTTMYVGNTLSLKLKGAKAESVKWKSSDPDILTVSSKGKLTALKKGTATITATYNEKKYKCIVTIKDAKLSERSLTLAVGQGFNLEALNTSGKVKWTSSNTTVAKVNANGFISPISKGKTNISAKIGKSTYVCKLKVVNAFGEDDFTFDEPEEGYTNYIDYSNGKGSNWYCYWNDAADQDKCNRNINIGDTYSDFISAYGYCESSSVGDNDGYKNEFSNTSYPRTYVELEYKDEVTQKYYYKKFYFDRNGTIVLIIWHR